MTVIKREQSGEAKRRKRELTIICFLLILIPIVLYYVSRSLRWNIELSVKHQLLVFTVININVILILLLLYLILRNLVKLFLQRKKGVLGAHLRIKLVTAFMLLSLFPTVILFLVSVQYIRSSVEYWFSRQMDKAISDANEMASHFKRLYVKQMEDEIRTIISTEEKIKEGSLISMVYPDAEIFSIDAKGHDLVSIELRNKSNINSKEIIEYLLALGCFDSRNCSSGYAEVQDGTAVYVVKSDLGNHKVVFAKSFPKDLEEKIANVELAYLQYFNMQSLKVPIKSGYIISLAIVSLLVLFVSMWFGVYVSREITIPIQALAEATKRISAGDYDFVIESDSKDEMGVLVNSFNHMTKEIKSTKEKIDLANEELKKRNQELTQQKQYTDFVISNIGAGVLSTDSHGIISTLNVAAKKILGIHGPDLLGKHFEEVLPHIIVEIVKKELSKRQGFRRQVKFVHEEESMNLLITVNKMLDEKGDSLGFVAVFEDLTEVEKAERMEAWQEVAKRIAHEVKNPLTPIQLSAQRLRKRLIPQLSAQEASVVNECTELILSQVEELKRLVNEFSMFARLPRSVKVPFALDSLVAEVFGVFKEKFRDIDWNASLPQASITVVGDKEQVRRAITNILNNAVEAVGKGGKISLGVTKTLRKILLWVEDSGPGIPAEYRHKVFEPYFSTKAEGGGLGLAIAHSIIKEHRGEIHIQDSPLGGVKAVIELPWEGNC